MTPDRLDIRIDKDLKAKLQERAKQEHRSTTQHLIFLIEQDLKPTRKAISKAKKNGS